MQSKNPVADATGFLLCKDSQEKNTASDGGAGATDAATARASIGIAAASLYSGTAVTLTRYGGSGTITNVYGVN